MAHLLTDSGTATRCTGRCTSQCDGCHSAENCVPASVRHGDLLLCAPCYRVVTIGGMDALAWALPHEVTA